MYPSDYGYASLSSNCSRDTDLYNYYSEECKNNNWIFNNNYRWTILPYSSDSYHVFRIYRSGGVYDGSAYYWFGISPVLYLNSSATLLSGEGTESEPYKLG